MSRMNLCNDWKFCGQFEAGMEKRSCNEDNFIQVRLPHTVKEVPFHYFDEHEYQMISCYRRHFFAPQEWEDKRLLLTIDGAAHCAEVFVNGTKLAEHRCGYTAFTVELTGYVEIGADNVIAIRLDSRETLNVPPFGFVVDYMTFGGLTREAYLDVREQTYISDVFVQSRFADDKTVSEQTADADLISRIWLNGNVQNQEYVIRQYLIDESQKLMLAEVPLDQLPKNTDRASELKCEISDITKWTLDNPKLYTIRTELLSNKKIIDCKEIKFGFRKAEFKSDGFYLNGQKVRIRGLNRHQSYPYVGYAMPESMQKLDADILKKELGCNAARTSHYPQSHHFIDRCDELGLLVFMEFPGWQHIGNDEWKEQAIVNLKEMITQYRNHTSIILWGVRINESSDDDPFYIRTNEVAHALDDSRQTGGVRAHKKSHLFEDVYTYNDFVHDGTNSGCEPKKKVTSDMQKGYLVSEYNGHMYPTKAYDWEEHRVQHALRHANVLNAVAGEADIAGSFGWCMFDYNTHKDFGSGDRICYHGVMDMFRNPKLASLIYACQQEEEPVLELSSTMDIGEHPGCNRGYTYIFSNADSVRMYKNEKFIKEYRSSDSLYKNLKHGPIVIDDFIGQELHNNEEFSTKQADIIKEALNYVALHGYHFPPRIIAIALRCMLVYHMNPNQAVGLYNKYIGDWGGTSTVYRFEAVKDGKVVKTIVKEPMHSLHMEVKTSAQQLVEKNTYDVAELRISMLDDHNNQLYFYNDPIAIETEGPLEVIGPGVVGFQGGMTGFYVRTIGKAGTAKVHLKSGAAEPITITFDIKTSIND